MENTDTTTHTQASLQGRGMKVRAEINENISKESRDAVPRAKFGAMTTQHVGQLDSREQMTIENILGMEQTLANPEAFPISTSTASGLGLLEQRP